MKRTESRGLAVREGNGMGRHLMTGSRERLVRRVQRELRASEGDVAGHALRPHDHAELQRRVNRLREAGPLFTGVCLSSHVMPRGMTRQPVRGGSGLVTTEA